MSDTRVKFVLDEPAIPTHWVNLMADIADPDNPPPPPLHPGTKEPAGPDDLSPIFPMALILQEVSAEPEIEIPEPVRDAYKLWRPTPLYRARRLEQALDTPAHIYYKYEGGSPAGSHKPNTAVAQAYENAQAGIKKLTTETGAGQWGSALAFACQLFGLECEVWMVGSSYDQKPYRRSMMETWGATVHRSPSDVTEAGRSQARAHHRFARDRDLRGGRGRGPEPGHELLARLGPQPRPAAPDRDRAGGDRPDGDGRRGAGHRDRVRRRRLELRRADVPVPAPRDPRTGQDPVHRRRAGRVPDADARRVRLRLRRHGRDDAADADVHARPRVRAPAGARRRPALPRRRAARVRPGQAGSRRAARLPPERDVRGGGPVRAGRGRDPRARARTRDPRGDRGGRGREARPARTG